MLSSPLSHPCLDPGPPPESSPLNSSPSSPTSPLPPLYTSLLPPLPSLLSPLFPPPPLPSETSQSGSGLRIWTDARRQCKLHAEYLDSANGRVVLKRDNGMIVVLALENLSAEDRVVVEILGKEEEAEVEVEFDDGLTVGSAESEGSAGSDTIDEFVAEAIEEEVGEKGARVRSAGEVSVKDKMERERSPSPPYDRLKVSRRRSQWRRLLCM